MGNILSLCIEPTCVDPDDWKSWDAHPAARHYLVGKLIGSGGFSEVYLAKRKPILFDGEEVALKVIFLGNPQLADGSKELLRAESKILQRLHHPNIVNVRRTYLWPRKQILIIEEEMLRGEDLLAAAAEAISDYGFSMTESFAARVMRQVLVALAYLHSRKVLHRDIKAENLRLTRPTSEWVHDLSRLKVKIIDFGLSCVQGEGSEVGWLGTPGYVAPEVIDRKPHTPAMDVYAAGVILFILLTGMKPMENEEAVKLSYSHVEAHDYPNMHGNARWDAVSGRAQSLVLQLMERDPDKRLTAQQSLSHPFLSKASGVPHAAAAAAAAKVTVTAPSAATTPAVPARPSEELRKETAVMKESDRLHVDGPIMRHTLEAERWRELIQLQASAAGGSPMSASSHSTAQTDVHALVQKAIRRGYSRSQRGRCLFGAGCAPAAALPRPVLPRAASMPTLSVSAASLLPPQLSPSPPPGPLGVSPPQSNSSVAGVPPMQLLLPPSKLGASPPTSEDSAAALPVAAAPPQALPAVRTAGVLRCWSAADLLAMGGAEMSPAGNQMHARAAAQEQLQAMAEHHLLNNSAAAEDLQQLAKEAAAA